MPSEENKFKRVIEFCMTKRGKDDILVLCDGRGRDNRRCIESLEKKLMARNHALVECWCVYVQPTKKEDPRAAARVTSYSINNREMAYFSLPLKGPRKVVHRSEFHSCGENSSAATTYIGISVRRFSELPRMCYDTKASILGAASCADLDYKHRRL